MLLANQPIWHMAVASMHLGVWSWSRQPGMGASCSGCASHKFPSICYPSNMGQNF